MKSSRLYHTGRYHQGLAGALALRDSDVGASPPIWSELRREALDTNQSAQRDLGPAFDRLACLFAERLLSRTSGSFYKESSRQNYDLVINVSLVPWNYSDIA